MTYSRSVVAILACSVTAAAVAVGEAFAAQLFQERYHFEVSYEVANFCGLEDLTLHEFVTDGKVRAVQRGSNGFEYVVDHLKETEVITNLANGNVITFAFTGTWKDPLKVIDNGDGTLTILALLTGTQALYGAHGKALVRSSGQNMFEVLLDHGGTPKDPSDDELIADLGSVKRTGRNDDFCAAAVRALT